MPSKAAKNIVLHHLKDVYKKNKNDDGKTDGQKDDWTIVQTERHEYGRTDKSTERRTNRNKNERTNGKTDVGKERPKVGRIDYTKEGIIN